MSAREFLTNVTVILSVMAIGAVLEIVVPMFAARAWRRDRRGANLVLTAVSFLLNWLLISVAAVAALIMRPAGLMARLVWVTPNVHKVHHSRLVSEANSNYANILTLFDRLLGTYTPGSRAESVVYGLHDADPARVGSLAPLLSMPFERAEPHVVPDTKVRFEESAGR